jgi:hypothetical protein
MFVLYLDDWEQRREQISSNISLFTFLLSFLNSDIQTFYIEIN